MSLVYLFAAMKTESQAVARLIGLKPDSASRAPVKAGQCGSNEVVLFNTGMGPRRARARTAAAFGQGIAQSAGRRGHCDWTVRRSFTFFGGGHDRQSDIPRKAGGLVSGAASTAVGEPPRMLPPEGLRNHRRRGSTAWLGTPSPGPARRGHPLPRTGEG